MSRQAALAWAADHIDGGALFATLQRRIALPTESRNPARADVLLTIRQQVLDRVDWPSGAAATIILTLGALTVVGLYGHASAATGGASMAPQRGLGQCVLRVFVAAIVCFLLLPIVIVIPLAFGRDGSLIFPPRGLSLRWFVNIFHQPQFLSAFALSALVAVLATSLALIAGGLAAYALVRFHFRGRAAIEMVFLTPLIFPAIVLGLALSLVLGSLGLLRNFWGLVLAHTILTLPYIIRTLTAMLRELDRSVEEAALILGAHPWRMVWLVLVRLLRPAILAGAIFALIISFDEFTVTLFLVGPRLNTLPIEIFNYMEFHIDPTVAAISTILIGVSCVAVLLIERLAGLARLLS